MIPNNPQEYKLFLLLMDPKTFAFSGVSKLRFESAAFSSQIVRFFLAARRANIPFESRYSQSIGQYFVELGMFVPKTADTDNSAVEETFINDSVP